MKVVQYKLNKIALFLALFLSYFSSTAQQPDLKSEILNAPDTKSELIAKGRNLLVQKLQSSDKEKVNSVTQYLQKEVSDKDFMALYPEEFWLLSLYTNHFEDVVIGVKNDVANEKTNHRRKVYPPDDLLFEKSQEILFTKRDSIFNEVEKQIALSYEDKAFLKLLFNYLTDQHKLRTKEYDSLNIMSDQYLATYPHSKYEGYVRLRIRYVFAPSPLGLDVEFFSGVGILTNNLKSAFDPIIPFGVAFEIYYNKHVLFLRDYIGISSVANDINSQSVLWTKGKQANFFVPEADYGFAVLDKRYMRCIPFVGIAATLIDPPSNDQDKINGYDKIGYSSYTWSVGMSADLKFGQHKKTTLQGKNNYGYMRIRYSYLMPHLQDKYGVMGGGIHSITLGFGAFSRPIKRNI